MGWFGRAVTFDSINFHSQWFSTRSDLTSGKDQLILHTEYIINFYYEMLVYFNHFLQLIHSPCS